MSDQLLISLLRKLEALEVSETSAKLHRTLFTAMYTTRRTLALGTSNRIDDFAKSNSWSMQASDLEWNRAKYQKLKKLPFGWRIKSTGKQLTPTLPYPRNEYIDPLRDIALFTDHPKLAVLVKVAISAKVARTGNCGHHAFLTAHHLWRFATPLIKRIEIISASNLDHSFVLVNRAKDSLLTDCSTWGDNCYLVDAWYGKTGMLSTASEFNKTIKKIIDFISHQKHELSQLGYHFGSSTDSSSALLLEQKIDILNDETPYPHFDDETSRSLEDYYDISPFYNESFQSYWLGYQYQNFQLRHAHQQKFKACLTEISDSASLHPTSSR